MIGQTLSHDRVLAKLGGGGMGVAYRAEGLKLGRAAALKFLPDDLSHDKNKLVDPKEAYMMSVNRTEFAGLLAREGLKTGLPEA
jgi:serine/threonine protein kinase